MTISVREADLRQDRDELMRFLSENLTKQSNPSRFEWLYLQNPYGLARAWIATNETTRRIAGVGAAFPRSVWVDGTVRRAWVLGDFCIAPECRSLGPALILQRSCLRSLESDDSSFCYDFPSRNMMAVYQRIGLSAAGQQVRFVKLMRIESKMREYVRSAILLRSVSAVGNLAMRLKHPLYLIPDGVECLYHDGLFGEEFTDFARRAIGSHRVHTLRTAEYLNWRYRQDPSAFYRVVVARRGSTLLGYGVIEVEGTDSILADLQVVEESVTTPALLAYVDFLLTGLNVHRLSIPIMDGSPLVTYLRRYGFRPRESCPVVAYAHNPATIPQSANNWFLMRGDRES
jgi:hypothetical protein